MYKKPTIIWGTEELYHPEPGTISEGAYYSLLRHYSQLPNIPLELPGKRMGLKSLGLEDEEIEKMCKPIDYDSQEVREKIMKGVAESNLREQRELGKWNKQRRLEEQQRLTVDGYL